MKHRLEQLAAMLRDIDSPQQLENLMIEGGLLCAQMVDEGLLPANDCVRDMVQTCRQPSVPRWDTSVNDFAYMNLFVHLAESVSDRPRTIYHTEKQQGSSVWRATKWNEDYRAQGQRYALFVAEMIEAKRIGPVTKTADARQSLGYQLWQDGKRWPEVAIELDGSADSADAVKQEVNRYAAANNLPMRLGKPGAPRKR